LYSGAAGKEAAQLGFISYILLGVVSVFGLGITLAWWQYADQT